MPTIPPIRYATGRVEPANLDHLRQLSYARNAARLKALQAITPPANWDSRTQNWIGPIKDQAQCGSCWDFSGTGVVEVACNVAGIGGGPTSMILSEQYTLDCAQNGGCNGDDNTTVLTWAQATGLPLSEAYGPYTSGSGGSSRCKWASSEMLYKIASWGFADSNGGQGVTPVADIKLAIMTYGCVGAAIAADDAFMNNPPGTVFQGSGSNQIDHDIILVGWDDVKGNRGAWILRNSWGSSWCDSGYCWIAYGANLVGTESVFAFVAPAPGPPPPPSPTPTPTPPPVPPAPPAPPGPNDSPFPTQGIVSFDFGTKTWSQSGFALKGTKPERVPSVRLGEYEGP